MAQLGFSLNPAELPSAESLSRDALPNGTYPVVIEDSTWKRSTAGNEFLELTLRIVDGPYKGRKLWDRLNLKHPKPEVVQIAQRTLSEVIASSRVTHAISDSSQLHNIPIQARVLYKPPEGPYAAKNEVRGYSPLTAASQGAHPGFAPAVPPAHQPSAGAQSESPPWIQ